MPRWGIIQDQTDEVGTWVCDRTGGLWFEGCGTAIGFTFDGRLAAGITYENFNGANVHMRFAVDPRREFNGASGRRVINRATAWAAFAYPFLHLGCRRVTAVVDSDNVASLAFVEHLGFAREATLKDAAPKGDLIVFRMLKSECRWLRNNRYKPKERPLAAA
jgi:RimJ/RimL family protein N-acetyltransferase